ncbi:unnamed protein product [Rotaria sordida]|uniref:Uncharacterized protein n=1 Tax=Rotaria sordida TaxID=392033 RepID=A0A814IQ73_9BILA|nr:unnamed protein product [Rotaria sordida]CAF3959459.1 unnamed protein product [Rotaria sordida]
MPIEIGQQALDFTLYNTEQKEISLKDLTAKSNVVILFFPLVFTKQNLSFDLLSYFNKDVSRQYDSLYEQFPKFALKGVTKRSAFVINKQGIIKCAEILAEANKIPDFSRILLRKD